MSYKNGLTKIFKQNYNKIIEYNFSRNPNYWWIFKSSDVKVLTEFQMSYPGISPMPNDFMEKGDELQKLMLNQDVITKGITGEKDIPAIRQRLQLIGAICKNWCSRKSAENVATMSCDGALYASMIGLIGNPNLVHYEYCRMTSDIEDTISRIMSNLVGYDPNESIGLFTQGGTMCNMYGYLAGIRKQFPDSEQIGIKRCKPFRFIFSQAGHYSNKTVLSILGVGTKEFTVELKLNSTNQIDLYDFRTTLDSCFKMNLKVPVIIITLGTTDTFAIDNIKAVYDIREEMCKKYNITVKPHLHADTAVGWPLVYFRDYDFDKNPLGINEKTIESLQSVNEIYKYLYLADSIVIDFHKWGFAPYISSMVLFKNKKDFYNLHHDPKTFTYFMSEDPTHRFESTIECSRGGVGLFGAYGSLMSLGKNGMQTIVAHGLQNANYLREKLSKMNNNVHIVAGKNNGPSVAFRLYPHDAMAQYIYESTSFPDDPTQTDEYSQIVKANVGFHRTIFDKMNADTLSTSWVGSVSHSNYNVHEICCAFPGEKAVFMNPRIRRIEIDSYISKLSNLIKTTPSKKKEL